MFFQLDVFMLKGTVCVGKIGVFSFLDLTFCRREPQSFSEKEICLETYLRLQGVKEKRSARLKLLSRGNVRNVHKLSRYSTANEIIKRQSSIALANFLRMR